MLAFVTQVARQMSDRSDEQRGEAVLGEEEGMTGAGRKMNMVSTSQLFSNYINHSFSPVINVV